MDTETKNFEPGFLAYQAAIARRKQALRAELAAIFPNPAEIVLELGSGHGHFLSSYAAQHPEQSCLGLDVIGDRVRRSKKKRDRLGLDHLRFLQAEATEFLDCLPPGISFERVFVLFPDPWPKKRHHKNRLLTTAFLTSLADRCRTGSDFYFRTDHRPYFDEVAARVGEHPRWTQIGGVRWPFEVPTVFQERAATYDSLVATCR